MKDQNKKKSFKECLREGWEGTKWKIYAGGIFFLFVSLYYFIK